MSLTPKQPMLDPLETVRQAYVLLRAASDHFDRLLAALPSETQEQLIQKLQAEGVATLLHRITLANQTTNQPARANRRLAADKKKMPLKDILLSVVQRNPDGLTLAELIDETLQHYEGRSKSRNPRHVVRTMISKLLREEKKWELTDGRHKPWPF